MLTPELRKKYWGTLKYADEGLTIRCHNWLYLPLKTGKYPEFTPLFNALERGILERYDRYCRTNPRTTISLPYQRHIWHIEVTEEIYILYLQFLERVILPHMQEPPVNRRIIITTHAGSMLPAYYDGVDYYVVLPSGNYIKEENVVVAWDF